MIPRRPLQLEGFEIACKAFTVAFASLTAYACSEFGEADPEVSGGGTMAIVWERAIGSGDSLHTPLLMPLDLAVHEGFVYVMDSGEPEIRILGDQGDLRGRIGSRGKGPGEFTAISGIAVSPDGRLAVADKGTGRITLFDGKGHLLQDFRSNGRLGDLEFADDTLLYVDHRGTFTDDRSAGAPTMEIVTLFGERVALRGEYEAQPHPVADGLHNESRFARVPNGGMWVLRTYTGTLERVSPDGRVTGVKLPAPRGRPPGGPYIESIRGDEGAVAIVRLPVAHDVTSDSGGRAYLLVTHGPDDKGRYWSEVLVYDTTGVFDGAYSLRNRGIRLAISDTLLYVLRSWSPEGSAIDVYRVSFEEESASRNGSSRGP